jgi:CXXC-20-CXXC protein
MQKCKKCLEQFKWKDIMKSIWVNSYGPIVCKHCNTKHHVNFTARLFFAFLITLPIFSFRKLDLYRIFPNYILFYIIWIALIICITPIFTRYHLKTNSK